MLRGGFGRPFALATAMLTLLVLAAVASAPQCRQIHYKTDGSVEERWVADTGGAATARTSGSSSEGSAHSSVSVRSSSQGSSSASSSSSSADADGRRRSVSITRDEDGCRIIIDERPNSGD
jgi:hypothetical protein